MIFTRCFALHWLWPCMYYGIIREYSVGHEAYNGYRVLITIMKTEEVHPTFLVSRHDVIVCPATPSGDLPEVFGLIRN